MTFFFAGSLLRFVDYQRRIHYDAPTLGEALNALVQDFPQLGPLLLGNGPASPPHRIAINGEVTQAGPGQTLKGGDIVEIITVIAGG